MKYLAVEENGGFGDECGLLGLLGGVGGKTLLTANSMST